MARRSKEFDVKIESEKLNKLIGEIESKISAVSLKSIIQNEVTSVLIRSAQITKKAGKKSIEKSLSLEKSRTVEWYSRKNKDAQNAIKKSFEKSGKKKALRMIYIYENREKLIAEKMSRVGAAKDGFLTILRELRLKPMNAQQMRGLGKLLASPPKIGTDHRNTSGQEKIGRKSLYTILTQYGNPVGRWADAKKALGRAISGRQAFYKRNLKEGVFKKASEIAKKYPGITLRKN